MLVYNCNTTRGELKTVEHFLKVLLFGFVCSVSAYQNQIIFVEYDNKTMSFDCLTTDPKIAGLISGLEISDEESMKSLCDDHVMTLSPGNSCSISNILFYASISPSRSSFPGFRITKTTNKKETDITNKIIGSMIPSVLIRKSLALCQEKSIAVEYLPEGKIDVFCEKLYAGEIYEECPKGTPLLDFPMSMEISETKSSKELLAAFQITKALYDNWDIPS